MQRSSGRSLCRESMGGVYAAGAVDGGVTEDPAVTAADPAADPSAGDGALLLRCGRVGVCEPEGALVARNGRLLVRVLLSRVSGWAALAVEVAAATGSAASAAAIAVSNWSYTSSVDIGFT